MSLGKPLGKLGRWGCRYRQVGNCREVLIAIGFEEEKSQEDSVLLDYIARVGIARRVGVQDIAG